MELERRDGSVRLRQMLEYAQEAIVPARGAALSNIPRTTPPAGPQD